MARVVLQLHAHDAGNANDSLYVQVADLVADLMHLMEQAGEDPDTAIERAIDNYRAERDEAELVTCAGCGQRICLVDSYSPGDEALCAACDTKVTGRQHG